MHGEIALRPREIRGMVGCQASFVRRPVLFRGNLCCGEHNRGQAECEFYLDSWKRMSDGKRKEKILLSDEKKHAPAYEFTARIVFLGEPGCSDGPRIQLRSAVAVQGRAVSGCDLYGKKEFYLLFSVAPRSVN